MTRAQQIESLEALMERKSLKFGERAMFSGIDDYGNLSGPIIGILIGESKEDDVMLLCNCVVISKPMTSDSGIKQPDMRCEASYTFSTQYLSEGYQIFSHGEIAPRLREDPDLSYYAPLFE